MLSNVSTLLLRLMIYRFVVYRNGIGVMKIQFAEEYKTAEKGETKRGFLGSRSRGRGPREEGCSKDYEHEEEDMTQGDSCDAHAKTEKQR